MSTDQARAARQLPMRNGLPYTRTLAAGLAVLMLALATTVPADHSWLDREAMLAAVLLAFCLWGLALVRNFFLDIMVILFSAFFLQRVVVVYFWPDQLVYQGFLTIDRDAITQAMIFALLSVLAIGLGYAGATLLRRRRRPVGPMTPEEPVRILSARIPFETFFRTYAVVAILLSILELALLVALRIGIAGVLFDPKYAVVFRLSFLTKSLSIIAFFPLVTAARRDTKMLALILLALQIVTGIGATSKGVLLGLWLGALTTMHFAGRAVRKRHVWYSVLVVVVVVVFYAPAVITLRGALFEGTNWREAIQSVTVVPRQTYGEVLLRFSERLNGLDLLVGLITVGRDAFQDYVGVRGDLVSIVISYIPRRFVARPDWVSPSYLMAQLLRGLPVPTEGAHTAHGENFTLPGMAFVYFGFLGGVVFTGLWAGVTTRLLSSRRGRIFKVLYFYYFVIVFFTGGGFVTPVMRFAESLISMGLTFVLYLIARSLRLLAVGGPAVRAPTLRVDDGE